MRQSEDPFIIQISGGDLYDRNLSGFSDRMYEGTGIAQESIGSMRGLVRPQLAKIYGLIAVILVVVLFGRLAYLQIIQGVYYHEVAEGNRIRVVVLPPPRGIIVDRRGNPLVANVPQFNLVINIKNLPIDEIEKEKQWLPISKIIGITSDEIKEKISNQSGSVTLVRNLSRDQSLALIPLADRLKGIQVEMISARKYEPDADLGHILGYMTLISPEEYKTNSNQYLLNDLVGRSGIESHYETELKGINGKQQVEVDNLGRLGRVSAYQAPVVGSRLTLTIDIDLQKKLVSAIASHLRQIGSRKAAAVIINSNNGDILALASFPTFDPNLFNSQPDAEEVKKVLADNDHPFFNRVISGEYPSGSTVKPILGAAALQEGVITPATTFISSGGVKAGDSFFADWKVGGHGVTNIYKAIAESVNTFFYMVGGGGGNNFSGLGIDRIDRYLSLFNFGKITGVDLSNEASGFIPTPQWKQQTFNDRWYLGDTYNLSIGQGNFLTTPLQLATAYSAIVNGGKILKPRLLSIVANGDRVENKLLEVMGKVPVDENNLQIIKEAMRQTVTVGSARQLNDLAIKVAGKTGTAEINKNDSPHSWFVGFFPQTNTQAVIVVLVENGGESIYAAVPIVREVLAWYSVNR